MPRSKRSASVDERTLKKELFEAYRDLSVTINKLQIYEQQLKRELSSSGLTSDALMVQQFNEWLHEMESLRLLMEYLSNKLQTMIYLPLYPSWKSLAVGLSVVREALTRYRHIDPGIKEGLSSLMGELGDVLEAVQRSSDVQPTEADLTEIDSEVKKVIREAELRAKSMLGASGP